ncbi:hypothetical protein [Agromyces soli]|uniref:Cell surface protein n=1 Tax=Agromyces soli TaxID=659012 RepID=A0ABY4AW04_9MICO|nr:hypothetical protein [Agromyces soli]UOE27339.1 hypothetical protein MTP13_06035 [Agromyces soli]
MTAQLRSPMQILAFAIAVGLNVALIVFFVLWYAADSQAVNAAEGESGFDQSSMIPHSNLLWVAAHTSLTLMLALDACLVVLWCRGSQRRRGESVGTP